MRVNKYILGIILLIGGFLLLLLVMIQSGWMYSKIEKEFQSITGYEIELNKKASIRSVVPKISFSFPTIIIKSPSRSGSISRLRLNNAVASFPLKSIGGQYLRTVALDVESMTVIVDTDTVPNTDTQTDVYLADNLQTQLEASIPFLADANLKAHIRELVIISRGAGRSASTYTLIDNQLNLVSKRLSIQGSVVSTKHPSHAYEIEADIAQIENKVAGSIFATFDMHEEERRLSLAGEYEVVKNSVDFPQIKLTGSGVNISGQMSAVLPEGSQQNRPKLSARFNAHHLELNRDRTLVYLSSSSKNPDELIFKDNKLDLFEHFDLDLKLTLGAVRLNNQPVVSGDFTVTAVDNEFALNTDRLVFLGGEGHLNIAGTPVNSMHRLSINSYVNDAQLSRLQITNDKKLLFKKGEADVKVSLKAEGDSAASLTRSLKGYFMFASHDVEISQRYAKELDRGLVSIVASNIDKLRRKRKSGNAATSEKGSLPVTCASAKLIINDGYLEVINGFVAELPDNTLLSSGYVDLHSEKMGFAFRTKKKKILDWSALSLIRFVELGGTLSQPKIMLDRKELMKQGLLTTTSVLVGARPPLVYQLAETGLDSLNTVKCLPHLTNK